MLKKAKNKKLDGGKSKMAADSSDDERYRMLPFSHKKLRKKDTSYSMGEIEQRANLFKDEFNQEDVHDRVLVLQVMPDDYEMRELTARLDEMSERTSTTANEVKSKAYVGTPGESSSVMSASRFYIDRHTEDRVREQSVIGLDSAVKSDRRYSDTAKEDTTLYAESPIAEFRNPSGIEINLSNATDVASNVSEGESGCVDAESVSYWNESKSERSDASRNSDCDMAYEGHHYTAETNKPSHYNLVEASDCMAETDGEAIDHSEVYSSMSGKPTPRPRTFFQNENYGFPENERRLNVDNFAIESGSAKVESVFAYGEKTELESVEYATGLDARNETQSSVVVESEPSVSASACDVHVLREHRIYVHACWLALNSRYFRSLLFESGMRECTSAKFCMKVTESEEDAFLLLLRSIYDPDVLDTIEINQLMNVLRLSVKYDVRFSTVKAKRVLEVIPLTLDVCETIIEAKNSGGLPDISKVMKNVEVRLLGEFEPLDETWESEKFATLSEHALRFILGSDLLIVQSENTVFIALMQWITKNAEVYGDITEYSDLLNLVRFELMRPTYIHDVVRGHETATQLDDFDAVYLKAITYHALPPKRRGVQCLKQRQWCPPKSPTFMWILYPEPEMFSFDENTSCNSTQSSSFWYFGYKMHLRLDLSTCQDESCLYLVVENLVDDGSIQIVYDVDVKFGEGLHKSFTCDSFLYRGNDLSSPPGNYPFNETYSLGEIKEILLGSSITVPITFEITLEKMLQD